LFHYAKKNRNKLLSITLTHDSLNTITLHSKNTFNGRVKFLPASKSISNRAIILNALAGNTGTLLNLSEANDTHLMQSLIQSENPVLDVEDAGTTMRFLTAYCAVTGKNKVITGTDRMKQRPIGILVDALRTLGADIEYLEKEGFPPVGIKGFTRQKTSTLSVRGDVSSQYISALMMVAPLLPEGLNLNFEGQLTSRPYVEMTAALMMQFGVRCALTEKGIQIPHQAYSPTRLTIESDWSAASYWFAFVALAKQAEVELPNMTLRSLQGDRVVIDIMEILGVKSEPRGNSLNLIKKDHRNEITWDFRHCPDLAQTVAVVCAAKGIQGIFTGLESLKIKETDRIKALQHELKKIGASFTEKDGTWTLTPSGNRIVGALSFSTYLDHRMAMAFAPLAALTDVTLENPDVVRKSYPRFWEDVQGIGFTFIQS
jgi:3-phosphoshikimate 1-carboxyvinyltransferase